MHVVLEQNVCEVCVIVDVDVLHELVVEIFKEPISHRVFILSKIKRFVLTSPTST